MWGDYKKAPNLMIAEMWKEILEGEGLPVRLLPQSVENLDPKIRLNTAAIAYSVSLVGSKLPALACFGIY